MPRALINGVEIAYEEAGSGFPLLWCHEFAGSMESWAPQLHYFSHRYRVITYNARGYSPSEVPSDPAAYSQDLAVEDIYGLLRHLGISEAYVGGLSMGASAALHFGIRHPEMARALIVAAAGTGSDEPDVFRANWREMAQRLQSEGTAVALADYAVGPTRVQLRRKDPTGWQQFAGLLFSHSNVGSALTGLGVQTDRPPIYVWEEQLKTLRVPTLVLAGDEDAPCLGPSLFLKRHIPSCGLAVFPQSGHTLNLEEPDLFNRTCADFLSAVEAGKWA